MAEHWEAEEIIRQGRGASLCGWHEETQLRIFQCKDKAMVNAQKNAFKLMGKFFHQHGLPAMVYVPFIKLWQVACNDKPMHVKGLLHKTINKAIST